MPFTWPAHIEVRHEIRQTTNWESRETESIRGRGFVLRDVSYADLRAFPRIAFEHAEE